ncbi:efflux RND transporter permease subunit [Nitrospirillum sp. BR 11163]|uniref:efflux RND transporter permease subunit n=1 Tax=Nitrospirillum sp. BR 11163 TaxID=3104323 RepID=UPI002AFDFD5B|nr:efflux RND transporter permease subunit [Nitrospirillum sp. BR 11163]MEA1672533.1 efflux RND transporter permease subunit [Nitrospirillum sp. BR 11163]
MWIVAYALRRPYSFAVLAGLITLLGVLSLFRMPTDIFPEVEIPTVTVVWSYSGLDAQEMTGKITAFGELAIINTADNVAEVESETSNGVGIIRTTFQPGVNIDLAISQISAICQTILKRMPTGTQPPLIVQYSRSSVPILQLALSSDTMSEAQLYDYGRITIRSQISDIPGMRLPLPYGGNARQIMVDINPDKLRSYGLTPNDVNKAITAQNLNLPSGTAKIGDTEYQVGLNSSPIAVDTFNDIPLRDVNGRTVFMRDVANVRDGAAVQTNVVHADGQPAVLLTIMKLGGASTLAVVDEVMRRLPEIRKAAPAGMRIEPLFDQTTFIKHAMEGIQHEGLIVGALVAILILLFLGGWRSTAIVLTSIPLSILTAVAVLSMAGHTLNVMTLGGLALAIGILVDDGTVAIENIHRHIGMGKPLRQAILEGSDEVAFPALVSTLCICIVFVPIFFLHGIAKYLFSPLALAVISSMLMSYVLSRTLVPAMAAWLLPAELRGHGHGEEGNHGHVAPPTGLAGAWARFHAGFERGFEGLRQRYLRVLGGGLSRPWMVTGFAVVLLVCAAATIPFVGTNFFPEVDAGQFRLHVRTPAGTRLEEASRQFGAIERSIRKIIPPEELGLIIDNIGLPDPVNLGLTDSVTVSSADGEILGALTEKRSRPTHEYVEQIRAMVAKDYPGVEIFQKPGDITSQILNGAVPTPIDIRIIGTARAPNALIAEDLRQRFKNIPGLVDVTLRQVTATPAYRIEVDRARAAELGLTQNDVAQEVLVSLASSGVVNPSYWMDVNSLVIYPVVVQSPQRLMASAEDLLNTPIHSTRVTTPVLLRNVAKLVPTKVAADISRTSFAPRYDVIANVSGRDLGSVSRDIKAAIEAVRPQLKPGNRIEMGGQIKTMEQAYGDIAAGMALAVVFVYMLMVVNFQSWLDPLIVLGATPAAILGGAVMLLLTGTTFSEPALMGMIMVIGVATANSVLMVSFANQRREQGLTPLDAMAEAGGARLRPVMMTALAMVLGMIPMALALSEGGEQNAPLARAVMGGLLFSTPMTLLAVPALYVLLHRRRHAVLATTTVPAGSAAE